MGHEGCRVENPELGHQVGPISMQPLGATKTSRTPSCWPWSISGLWTRSTTAPVLSAFIPNVQQDQRVVQLTTFGATIPALDPERLLDHQPDRVGVGAQSSGKIR